MLLESPGLTFPYASFPGATLGLITVDFFVSPTTGTRC